MIDLCEEANLRFPIGCDYLKALMFSKEKTFVFAI